MAEKLEQLNVDLTIKQVSSDDVLKDMEDNDQLGANQLIFTETDTEVPMMPVGTIFASAIPITDARVHLLDGSIISQTGVYETFANLIKTLEASGQPITCTQDEFDTDVTTYGQCGKFVVDNNSATIRLPFITEFIASNNGGQTIGLAQLDMFKSHNHYGIRRSNAGTNGGVSMGSSNGDASSNYGTDYTGGEETRPKNIRYPYYIVIAKGYKSSQVVNVDNIMNDVNSKLPLAGGTLSGNLAFPRGKGIKSSGGANMLEWNNSTGYITLGGSSISTLIAGYSERPAYNATNNPLALLSDTVSNRGYIQIAPNQSFSVDGSGAYGVIKLSQSGNSITMTTSGRGVLAVRGGIYCKITSGTVWVALYIDGVNKGECLGIHTSVMYMPLEYAVSGLSAGEHTIQLKWKGNNSGSTISIPNYAYTNLFLWEY